MKYFRIHSLGIPHTITSKDYLPCAFTQKVYNGTGMFTDIGHTTFHYGAEGSTVRCTEHIDVTTLADFVKTYGDVDYWKIKEFAHSRDSHLYQEFYKNTITELRKRIQPGDFLLCWWGTGHKQIADAVADLKPIVVEPGIGYPTTFAPYRVFESYAKLHIVKGQIDMQYKVYEAFKDTVPEIANWDASQLVPYTHHDWYDDVIPNYFDPNDFQIPVPSHADREDFILFIGRLTRTKGLEVAMRVADKVGMPLYVAGQGDFEENMGWKPYDCVQLLGTVDVHQRRDLIARARAGICASLFPEPFCGVHVEMGLGGLPVLTTDVGVFTETVVDGQNGWRCKEFNDFVIAMENIRDIDPQTCHEMAMDYQMERVALRYQDYFERVYTKHTTQGFWYLRPEKTDLEFQKRYLPQDVVQEKLAALKAAPTTDLGGTYHPGGAIIGGDPFLQEPDIWDYCVDAIGAKTILDIGAGEAHAAKYFADNGCTVYAIDADAAAIANAVYPVIELDLTETPVRLRTDMVYMAEFVEHLPAASLPHLADSLQQTECVLMTYAIPGNDGVGHVNLQDMDYWMGWMSEIGFDIDAEKTNAVRLKAKHVHFKNRGLVFRRSKTRG